MLSSLLLKKFEVLHDHISAVARTGLRFNHELMFKFLLRHINVAGTSTLRIAQMYLEILYHTCSYDLMSVRTMFSSAFLALTSVASCYGY